MSRVISKALAERVSAGASATVLLWVCRTLLSLLVAYPLLSALEATGIENGPDRDAVLFQPGALLLLELVRVGMPLLGAALKTTAVLFALGTVLELAPLACALDVLSGVERTFSARTLRSVRLIPTFFSLSGIALAAEAALLLATSLLAGALRSAFQKADPRVLSVAPLALGVLCALLSLWLSSVLDLARAAAVERGLGFREALIQALTVLIAEPIAVLSSAYANTAAGVAAYLGAAWLTTQLSVAGYSGWPIACAFVIHQLALLIGIAWRVRWIERAITLSAAAPSYGSIRN